MVLAALAGLGAMAALAFFVVLNRPAAGPVPISSVDTQDVHSLAFVGSTDRLLLGHHGGILESRDGGRTWRAWGPGADAMAMGIAGEEVVVAGHEVLAVATPDGSWQNLDADLPHTDIHGFARDPRQPSRMWAYLAGGGLYESLDGGAHWTQVSGGHTLGLVATVRGDATRLIAADPERGALVASDDGGRSWQVLGSPPSTPVYALGAAAGGQTVLLSGSTGLHRSSDGGTTFSRLVDVGEPILALAVAADGQTIVFATRDRQIFRSDDGGLTWPSG